jgi:hypothetical protein
MIPISGNISAKLSSPEPNPAQINAKAMQATIFISSIKLKQNSLKLPEGPVNGSVTEQALQILEESPIKEEQRSPNGFLSPAIISQTP